MNKSLHTHLNVRSLYESLFSCLIVVFLLASCQSYKKVPYLQDAGVVKDINQQENLYDAKIMPKDLLTIVVSCTSPELAVPFNDCSGSWHCGYWEYTVDSSACPTALSGG